MDVIDALNDSSSLLTIGTRFLSWVLMSMNEIKSINQYSRLISIEHTRMNHQVVQRFEDLEYLNTFNIQYSEILSNVTERG